MVAVDESENARSAFFAALKLIQKDKDHLILITVVDDLAGNYRHHFNSTQQFTATVLMYLTQCT